MDEFVRTKRGKTEIRSARAMDDKAFTALRTRKLIETQPADLLHALERGGVSTNVFLRRLHNFALGMNWLPWPVLARKQWPAVRFGEKRAITLEEHTRIVRGERNPERRAFYELCWHLGGAQSDVANLKAKDIDWKNQVVSFFRAKTNVAQVIRFGAELARVLRELPQEGLLFPKLAPMLEAHRATEFRRVCRRVEIQGVTLHSYRYAWAERAKSAGYPERFAQIALGHNSKAVHRAYARKAQVVLPALEDYEKGEVERLPVAALQQAVG
jgi:integrase